MSYGVATQTGVSVAIQSIPSMSANKGLRNGYGATFYENFADGTDTLDPRITFSRASNATVTNSSGNIVYAPHNLCFYSEQFNQSVYWVAGSITVSSNATTAPDGTITADSLVEDGTLNNHNIYQAVSCTTGIPYTFSCYIKASSRSIGYLRLGGAINKNAFFNLSTGAVGTVDSGLTASITAVGNGWYRASVTYTPASTGNINWAVGSALVDGTTSYTGTNGTVAISVWGAQLEARSSAGTYNSTTVKNLLGYSEAFDNAAWTKAQTSVTANQIAAPNGTVTADLITATGTVVPRVVQSYAYGAGTYTLSVYAKAGTTSSIGGTVEISGTQVLRLFANLTTGATTQATETGTISATSTSIDVGNGWWRFAWIITIPTAGTYTNYFAVTDTYGSFTVTVGKSVYLWGAQLSDAASVTPYVNNPVAAPSAAAYYAPRFDYDPVTLQPRGLLIEEQRTNLQIRSEEFNTATTWQPLGGTVTSNTIVSPDGTQDADTFTEDVGVTNHGVSELTTAVTNGVTYTVSVYAKAGTASVIQLLGRATPFGANIFANFNLATGTVGAIGSSTTASIQNVGNGWYRCIMTGAAIATTTGSIAIVLTNGDANAARFPSYNGTGKTIHLWGAQVEAGAFATSYIPTVASQVTRSADNALMQGSNFSGWYNQSEGTISTIVDSPKGTVVVGTGNTFADTQYLTVAASNNLSIRSGNADVAVLTTPISTTAITKAAWVYKANDFRGAYNGTLSNADTAGAVPVDQVRMVIGAASWTTAGGNYLNGYIRQIAYYPTRLQNSQLQAITQ